MVSPYYLKRRIVQQSPLMTELRSGLPVVGFANAEALETWLTNQPAGSSGLWIKFAKTGSGIASVSKSEAIDAALCHGWIDGQLNKYDEQHWLIRFTPRKARSKWSGVNRARVGELIESKRVREAGLEQVRAAKADGRWDAAYAPASTAQPPGRPSGGVQHQPSGRRFFRNAHWRQQVRNPLPDRGGEEAGNPGPQDRRICPNAGAWRDDSRLGVFHLVSVEPAAGQL